MPPTRVAACRPVADSGTRRFTRCAVLVLLTAYLAACSGSDQRSVTNPDGATLERATSAGTRRVTISAARPITNPYVVPSVTGPFSATNKSVTTFTVTNTGSKVTSELVVALSNTTADATAFSIASGDDECTGHSLGLEAKHNSCTVKVTFSPSRAGTFTGTIAVTLAQPRTVTAVNLSGAGVNPQMRRDTLVAGAQHSCELTADGTAYCWGYNRFGQLGTPINSGTDEVNPTATTVTTTLKFASLTAGANHTCGLTADGKAYCWGSNLTGQLGRSTNNGTAAANPTVTAVATTLKFASLTAGAGGSFTCGLTADGTAYCWGENANGQLGTSTNNGTQDGNPSVVAVATTLKFAKLTAGSFHTCGLTARGTAYCWGYNAFGQLGTTINTGTFGTMSNNPTPAAVATTLQFASLTAGDLHTCGLAADGSAYCWGYNALGQLGTVTNNDRDVANPTVTAVATALKFASLTAGQHHTCGLTADEIAYCWGLNTFGQLGTATNNGTAAANPTATAVATSLKFASLSAGANHTCGIAADATAYCWGYNGWGQLGDGTTNLSFTPVLVSGSRSSYVEDER